MKQPISKQAYLKGLLLAALAANVSWGTTTMLMNADDFASIQGRPAGEVMVGGAGGRAGVQPSERPEAPPGAPLTVAPDGIGPSANGPKADAPVTVQRTRSGEELPSKLEFIDLCGKTFEIKFQEILERGEKRTTIRATPRVLVRSNAPNTRPIQVNLSTAGTLDEVLATESRASLDPEIRKAIREKVPGCRDDDAAVARDEARPGAPAPVDRTPEERKARIARGVKNCTLNEDGTALRGEDARMECNISRVRNVETESPRTALSQITNSVANLRALITAKLKSSDRADEGEAMIDETVEAIREASAVNGMDAGATSKMIESLKALRVGGQVYRASNDAARDVGSLRESLTQAVQDYKQNPQDPSAQMQVRMLMAQQQQIASQIQTNLVPLASRIQSYQMSQLMSGNEAKDWLNPFNTLRNDFLNLNGINGSGGPQSIGLNGQPLFDTFTASQQNEALLRARLGLGGGTGLTLPYQQNNLLGNLGLNTLGGNTGRLGSGPIPVSSPSSVFGGLGLQGSVGGSLTVPQAGFSLGLNLPGRTLY